MGTKMRLHIVVAIMALFVFASVALAFNVHPSDDSITAKITETGKLDVTIETEPGTGDIFVFSLIGEQPWMILPTSMEIIHPSIGRTFSLVISPFATTKPTTYNVILVIESFKTGERTELPITVIVRSSDATVEHITVENTAPASTAKAQLFLKNHEDKEVEFLLEYEVAGTETLLTKSQLITLGPNEFRIIEDSFEIPECYPAGVYGARARLLYKGVEAFSLEEEWEVPEQVIIIKEKSNSVSGLATETGFLLRNVGNVKGTAEVSDDVWGALFYEGDEPTKTTDGKYTWQRQLGPCESAVVGYNVNYLPVAGVFFLIGGLWLVFFRLRSMRISKRILQKDIIKKGTEYTVGIHVKSLSHTKDIIVKDFVPPAFEIRQAHGGLAPDIEKKAGGSELTWRLSHMKTYEERVLAYKLVPLFSVIGKVRLPRAHVSFVHLGRSMLRMSPIAHLGEELVHATEEVEGNLLRSLMKVVKFGK